MSRWVHDGIRAVFFDAVGTVILPEPPAIEIYAAVARRHGLNLDPATIRKRFIESFNAEESTDRDRGWATSEEREVERWRRIVSASLRELADPGACFVELYDHFARPDAWRVPAEATAVFRSLQSRGIVLGLASNYDSRLSPVIAGHADLAPLRDRVVISAAVGCRKPARAFFEQVTRIAGCRPDEILLVGDDLDNDYNGAAAAGLEAVLLDPAGRHVNVPRRIETLAELIP
jgi:putative hydrolase of the HAD superfamily